MRCAMSAAFSPSSMTASGASAPQPAALAAPRRSFRFARSKLKFCTTTYLPRSASRFNNELEAALLRVEALLRREEGL